MIAKKYWPNWSNCLPSDTERRIDSVIFRERSGFRTVNLLFSKAADKFSPGKSELVRMIFFIDIF